MSKVKELVKVSGAIFEKNSEVLIVREPNGQWSLPGGTAKPNESPLETLLRELSEKLIGLSICGVPEVFRHFAPSGHNHREITIFLVETDDGIIRPNPLEIADTRWINYSVDGSVNLPREVIRSLQSLRKKRHRPPPKILD
ncbi:MAG: NUDIX hydrolase [Patescibacteria group bacterium]